VEKQTVRQLQGAIDLLHDATTAAADAIGTAQADTARVPYAVLKAIPGIRRPAAMVERTQSGITELVYWSIRSITVVSTAAASRVLRRLDRRDP
jgi:hypothetical protein